eukprot:CAMPEP_0184746526 /NCGR_PEP_ID=MMETSP0315-20130426/9057_1 /TAXON_ID=101924 /ORGANISM="Rhodosorus marinus, Strain UTEX LB 2760" /LENGTH=349 /DNA_ID=CAMNT_0027219139 /DNA_START=311 /DNA_END=1360 /DNA_ORIENTATION=+
MTNGALEGCEMDEPGKEMELDPSNPVGQIITFSYDIEFVEDTELHWATRWDPLLMTDQAAVSFHRRYLLYSLLVTFILSFLVAMVLARTVYLDYVRYDNLDSADEIEAESGWKQVHGDVFRPPEYKEYLSICVGCGTQITVIVIITLAFSLLGFWSPAYRGGLLTSLILLWVLTSVLGGFVSALLHSEFGGKNRKVVTLGSAFFFFGEHVRDVLFREFGTLRCWIISGSQIPNATPATPLVAVVIRSAECVRSFLRVQTETEGVSLSYQPLAQGDTRILQGSAESVLLLERIDPFRGCLHGASVRHGSLVAEKCLHNGRVFVRCILAIADRLRRSEPGFVVPDSFSRGL